MRALRPRDDESLEKFPASFPPAMATALGAELVLRARGIASKRCACSRPVR
jgi:hypothetical protein